MPNTTVQLTGGNFQNSSGTVLSDGYVLLQLSQDAQVNGSSEICADHKIKILLDSNGNVQTSPPQYVWPNDVLAPPNTFYTAWAYSSLGELVWGPNAVQIFSTPSPYNIGAWVPGAISFVPTQAGPYLLLNPPGSQSVNIPGNDNITFTQNDLLGSSSITLDSGIAFNINGGNVNVTSPTMNLYSIGAMKLNSNTTMNLYSTGAMNLNSNTTMNLYSTGAMNLNSNTTMNLDSIGAMEILSQSTLSILGSGISILGMIQTAFYTVSTTPYTVGTENELFDFYNAASAVIVANLPAAGAITSKGLIFYHKKIDSSVNTVTITASTGDTIDGAATYVLSAQYKYVNIICDGVHTWHIFGSN